MLNHNFKKRGGRRMRKMHIKAALCHQMCRRREDVTDRILPFLAQVLHSETLVPNKTIFLMGRVCVCVICT